MRRRVVVVVGLLFALFAVTVFLGMLQKQRANRDVVYSINNLRELGQFAEVYLSELPDRPAAVARWEAPGAKVFTPVPVERLREVGVQPAVPAGTLPNASLPPEQRLSWVAGLLPTFNQMRQPTAEWAGRLDLNRAWNVGPNAEVARERLEIVRVYTNPTVAPAGEPAWTQFVGVGGVGEDAPANPFGPTSGAFRYDAPMPFEAITDGLSHTVLFADVSTEMGPWMRGGPATVRTFQDSVRPVIGRGGQFGGNLPAGALFGFADHSVRVLTPQTSAVVVRNLCTAAGGAADPMPGE